MIISHLTINLLINLYWTGSFQVIELLSSHEHLAGNLKSNGYLTSNLSINDCLTGNCSVDRYSISNSLVIDNLICFFSVKVFVNSILLPTKHLRSNLLFKMEITSNVNGFTLDDLQIKIHLNVNFQDSEHCQISK